MESRTIHRVTIEESESESASGGVSGLQLAAPRRSWRWVFSGLAILAICGSALIAVIRHSRPPPMNEADLVLVSDFVNTTGEPVFDGSLKQALTVKLAESPYFNLVLDAITRQTLKLMDRSPDERVVPPLAREVCQREGAKVTVTGAILRLGDKDVLDLDAINCLTGASLAHEEIDAPNRDRVLNRLGQAIPRLRRKLGESLSSIRRFDTPIEQATTKSLAALKAYTAGDERRSQGKDEESIQFYKLAIDLDPEFAIAYARLGAVYSNLNQPRISDQYLQQAFERRGHVTEREQFYIAGHSLKDTDTTVENCKLWGQVYPHDWIPFNNLSDEYSRLGEVDKAVEAGQQALRLNPNHSFPYGALAQAYQRSSRFTEARTVCEKAIARKLDGWTIHRILWEAAFVEDDTAGLQREEDWFKGQPMESWIVYEQATTDLSFGQFHKSQSAFQRSRTLAINHDLREFAAAIALDEAQFDADLGNTREVRSLTDESLRLAADSPDIRSSAAVALARAGDVRRSEDLINKLKRQGGLGKLLEDVTLAGANAGLALDHHNPAAAIEQLRPAIRFDLASSNNGMTLYYRGLAYLELK